MHDGIFICQAHIIQVRNPFQFPLQLYCTHRHLYLGELKLPVICRNSLNERQFCSMAWHQTAPMGTFRRPPPSCSREPATIEKQSLSVEEISGRFVDGVWTAHWLGFIIRNLFIGIPGNSLLTLNNAPVPVQATLKIFWSRNLLISFSFFLHSCPVITETNNSDLIWFSFLT